MTRVIRIIVLILIASVTHMSCSNKENKKTSEQTSAVPEITVEQLHADVENDVEFYLLDVRTQPEFSEQRVSFADDLIPYDSIADYLDDLPENKDTLMYIFCRTGRRSGITTEYLRSIGYTNVFNVVGGIVAWQEAGYEIVSD